MKTTQAIVIHGIEGTLEFIEGDRPGVFKCQKFTTAARPYEAPGYPKGCQIRAVIRFDDECGNGHNSFTVTGEIFRPGARDIEAGGCIHEDIAKHFPTLAHLIKWHLCDVSGPMHYIANAVFLAGDRDCWGLRKGEKRQLRNGKTGLPSWELVAVDAAGEEIPTYKLPKYQDGETPPADTPTLKWVPWCRVGEGKERELDKARSVAIWPEATDAELTQEPDALEAALQARLPALLAAFRADVKAAGLKWIEPVEGAV